MNKFNKIHKLVEFIKKKHWTVQFELGLIKGGIILVGTQFLTSFLELTFF